METNLLRALALMQHLGEDYFILNDVAYKGTEDEVKKQFEDVKESYDDFTAFCNDELEMVEEIEGDDYNSDYMVLTDNEADKKWDEELENYIDECILYELPKQYRRYFDNEAWKNDARQDGRGHSLGRYDGEEHEETVEGETFYIYRVN